MSEGVGGENMCGAERIKQKTPTLSLFMRKESQSIHVGASTSETNRKRGKKCFSPVLIPSLKAGEELCTSTIRRN